MEGVGTVAVAWLESLAEGICSGPTSFEVPREEIETKCPVSHDDTASRDHHASCLNPESFVAPACSSRPPAPPHVGSTYCGPPPATVDIDVCVGPLLRAAANESQHRLARVLAI